VQDRFLCKFHRYIYVLQSWFSVWRLIRRKWGPPDTNKRLHSLVERHTHMHTEIFKSYYNIYNLQLPNSLVTTHVQMNGFGRSLRSLQDTIERRCQAWRMKILQHCLRRSRTRCRLCVLWCALQWHWIAVSPTRLNMSMSYSDLTVSHLWATNKTSRQVCFSEIGDLVVHVQSFWIILSAILHPCIVSVSLSYKKDQFVLQGLSFLPLNLWQPIRALNQSTTNHPS
jgi:hypothetical protein